MKTWSLVSSKCISPRQQIRLGKPNLFEMYVPTELKVRLRKHFKLEREREKKNPPPSPWFLLLRSSSWFDLVRVELRRRLQYHTMSSMSSATVRQQQPTPRHKSEEEEGREMSFLWLAGASFSYPKQSKAIPDYAKTNSYQCSLVDQGIISLYGYLFLGFVYLTWRDAWQFDHF